MLCGAGLVLAACQKKETLAVKELRVGVIDGPEAQLVEAAAEVAKGQGLTVKLVRFTDYVSPNAALAEGSLDLNAFQHKPYLDETIKARGFKLVPVGNSFLYPMGLYSKKIKSLAELSPKSKVAIPNDPSNEGRALMVLAQAGLLTLKEGVGVLATPADILSNPKALDLVALDAAQTVRALDDVVLAAINTNYAVASGLKPLRDAIFIETKESPYMNLLVAKEKDANDPRIVGFVKAYQSQAVLSKAIELFEGASVAGFEPK